MVVSLASYGWEWRPKNLAPVASENLTEPLGLWCAAAMREPMDEIISAFKKETGTDLEKTFGASGAVIAQMDISRRGDVYISADEDFMSQAQQKKLVGSSVKIAKLEMVLAVAKGNPKHISSLDDLVRENLKVGIAQVNSTAAGRITKEKLGSKFDKIHPNIKYEALVIGDLANAVDIGSIDVAFLWKPIALQHASKMDWIDFEGNEAWISWVCAAPLHSSKHPNSADKFVHWLKSSVAQKIFVRYGYEIPEE